MQQGPTRQFRMDGYDVFVDDVVGHLWVEHDGHVTWDQLQRIKTLTWGKEARAIEVYPAHSQIVNSCNCRHLWRLGQADFAPDLLGDAQGQDSLQTRFTNAWAESQTVLPNSDGAP